MPFSTKDAPSFDVLNTCVQCGLCLPTCPTYRETYREQSSPRGRLRLMLAVHNGEIDVLDPTFTGQMSECLDCRACEAVCPSGVRYGQVLEASRAQIDQARAARGQRSPVEKAIRAVVFGQLLARPTLFRAASRAGRLYQRSGAQAVARSSGLLRRLAVARLESQMPHVSQQFTVARGQSFPAEGERRGRVALLTGCIMSTAYARVHEATIRVLARNGWEVVLPSDQGCCGALHVHSGDLDGGRDLLRRNIAAFEASGAERIVSNAAGCGALLKEAGELLRDDPHWATRAERFCAACRDITEVLAEQPLRGELGSLDITVTYQEPCHLAHAQRIAAAPRALLQSVPGLRLVEMAESSLCCGSAGIYGVTHPEMSERLRERKLTHALATGASVIVTANPGCAMQLEAGLAARGEHTRVRHVVEVLDAGYRRGRK